MFSRPSEPMAWPGPTPAQGWWAVCPASSGWCLGAFDGPFDVGGVGLSVELDLSRGQCPGQRTVHSPADGGDDMVQRRSGRGDTIPHAIVLTGAPCTP